MSQTSISPEVCPAACPSSGITQQFRRPTGWVGGWMGQLMAVKNRKRSKWVIELLQVQPDDHILEVGFGSGIDIGRVSAIATHGFIAGIDHSEVMVKQARKRNAVAIQAKHVDLQCASAASIPYTDAMFDKLFAINVAQFWPSPTEVLAELRRVLKPGGLIALAIQPRIPNATEATSQETGKFLANLLKATQFEQVQINTHPMQPVSVVCVLGLKSQA